MGSDGGQDSPRSLKRRVEEMEEEGGSGVYRGLGVERWMR